MAVPVDQLPTELGSLLELLVAVTDATMKKPFVTTEEILERYPEDKKSFSHVLANLIWFEVKGYIEKNSKGEWRLTKKGVDILMDDYYIPADPPPPVDNPPTS